MANHHTSQMMVRLTVEDRRRLDELAARQDRPTADYARHVLRDHLRETGAGKAVAGGR